MQHAGLQHRALRVRVLPDLLNAPVTQRKSIRLRTGLSWVRVPPGVLTYPSTRACFLRVQAGILIDVFLENRSQPRIVWGVAHLGYAAGLSHR